MEVRIGIVNVAREIGLESSQTAAEIEQLLADALASGAPYVRIADEKGKRFLVPTAGIAYVEIGAEESRRVGFVA
ncbi:MAG: ATP-binding protein [Micrococcales bacterium 73-13]|nr:MAG: ATP-binding protein [Micrococcales bacterium 73-13]